MRCDLNSVIGESILVLIRLCNTHNSGQRQQQLQGDKGEVSSGPGYYMRRGLFPFSCEI